MKWVRDGQCTKAEQGNLTARVFGAGSKRWELVIQREWLNHILIEDQCRCLVEGIFETQTKAKAAGEALLKILGGDNS